MLLKCEDTLVKTLTDYYKVLSLNPTSVTYPLQKKKAEQNNILLYFHQIIFIFCLKREMRSSG